MREHFENTLPLSFDGTFCEGGPTHQQQHLICNGVLMVGSHISVECFKEVVYQYELCFTPVLVLGFCCEAPVHNSQTNCLMMPVEYN